MINIPSSSDASRPTNEHDFNPPTIPESIKKDIQQVLASGHSLKEAISKLFEDGEHEVKVHGPDISFVDLETNDSRFPTLTLQKVDDRELYTVHLTDHVSGLTVEFVERNDGLVEKRVQDFSPTPENTHPISVTFAKDNEIANLIKYIKGEHPGD